MQMRYVIGALLVLLGDGSLWGWRRGARHVARAGRADARGARWSGGPPRSSAVHGTARSGLCLTARCTDALEFFKPHKSGNGRSCATCHRPEDHFALTPATVEARYQALQARRQYDPNADDPLFRSIDADDFDQDFTTLRTKALVRVVLPLPPNVQLADDPAATTVAVWRAVPTSINSGITAPYQADGRLGTLEDQALSAMHAHSEITHDPTAEYPRPTRRVPAALVFVRGRAETRQGAGGGRPPAGPRPAAHARSNSRGRPRSSSSAPRATAARRRPSTPTRAFCPSPSGGRCPARRRSSTSSCKPLGPPPLLQRPPRRRICRHQAYVVTLPNGDASRRWSPPTRGAG